MGWKDAPLVEDSTSKASWQDAPEVGGSSVLDKPAPSLMGVAKDVAAGAVRGAGSIGATLIAPYDIAKDALAGKGLSLESNRQRRADMDSALANPDLPILGGADTNSLGYQAGKLGAEVAGTLGAGGVAGNALRVAGKAAPTIARGANMLADATASGGLSLGANAPAGVVGRVAARAAGGALSGAASAGLVNPADVGQGAAAGAALPIVGQVVGKGLRTVGNALGPNQASLDLGRTAQKYGIPVTAGDLGGTTTKALRSVLSDAPLIGAIGAETKSAQQKAYNKAVGSTFGAAEESLTPQVVDQAKARLGSEFDRIWNANSLSVDAPLVRGLADLRVQAGKLPQAAGDSLQREIDDLLSKVKTDPAGNPIIPGDVANKFQSYLRRRAEGSQELRNELGDMRQSIIGAFNRSVSPADAAALTLTRSQYKAFKTVEPLLTGAELGVAGRMVGDVPASMLPQAVRKGYSDPTGTELGDLAAVGSNLLADRVVRTGGSARAAVQNGLLGAGLYANPGLALGGAAGAAGLAAALNSPRLGARMLKPSGNLLGAPTRENALRLLGRAAPVLLSNPG